MRLKISKEKLMSELDAKVFPYAQEIPDISKISPRDLKFEIERYARTVAKDAVMEALKVFMDNVYSEEEFESDLGLDR